MVNHVLLMGLHIHTHVDVRQALSWRTTFPFFLDPWGRNKTRGSWRTFQEDDGPSSADASVKAWQDRPFSCVLSKGSFGEGDDWWVLSVLCGQTVVLANWLRFPAPTQHRSANLVEGVGWSHSWCLVWMWDSWEPSHFRCVSFEQLVISAHGCLYNSFLVRSWHLSLVLIEFQGCSK